MVTSPRALLEALWVEALAHVASDVETEAVVGKHAGLGVGAPVLAGRAVVAWWAAAAPAAGGGCCGDGGGGGGPQSTVSFDVPCGRRA